MSLFHQKKKFKKNRIPFHFLFRRSFVCKKEKIKEERTVITHTIKYSDCKWYFSFHFSVFSPTEFFNLPSFYPFIFPLISSLVRLWRPIQNHNNFPFLCNVLANFFAHQNTHVHTCDVLSALVSARDQHENSEMNFIHTCIYLRYTCKSFQSNFPALIACHQMK